MLSSLALLLVVNAAPTPRVVMSTLLESRLLVGDTKDPSIHLAFVQLAFPPPNDDNVKVVVRSGSTVIAEQPMTIKTRVGNLATAGPKGAGFTSLGTEPGPRTLEVLVNGEVAGKLDFVLNRSQGGDALAPKTMYEVVGPWKDYAYITYEAEPRGRNDINVIYWVSLDELNDSSARATVSMTVKQGSQIIAKGDDRYPNGGGYSRFIQPFRTPSQQVLSKETLAGLSGTLTFEVTHKSKVIRQWDVKVENGAFVPHERSNHETTEATAYLAPRRINGRMIDGKIITWLAPSK